MWLLHMVFSDIYKEWMLKCGCMPRPIILFVSHQVRGLITVTVSHNYVLGHWCAEILLCKESFLHWGDSLTGVSGPHDRRFSFFQGVSESVIICYG